MAKRQCAWVTASGKCPNKCGYRMENNPDDTKTRKYNTFCDKHQKLHDSMQTLVVDICDRERDWELPKEFLEQCFLRGLIGYTLHNYFIPSILTKEQKEQRLGLLGELYKNFLRDYMK